MHDDFDFDEEKEKPAKPRPTYPPPPTEPEETQEEVVSRFEREFLPTILVRASKMEGHVDVPTLIAARENFLNDAGDPKDPVERALLDQIFVLRFRALMALVFAANLDPEAHVQIMSVSLRMNAEVRKTALALKTLRAVKATRKPSPKKKKKKKRTPRPPQTPAEGDNFAATNTRAFKVVQERRRSAQPVKAPRPVGRRKSAIA